MSDLTREELAAIEARDAVPRRALYPSEADRRTLLAALREAETERDQQTVHATRLLAALTAAEARVELLTDALREPQTISFVDEASARRFYAASARAVTHLVAAEARTEAVTIGPIRHAASLCAQPSGCNCWCAECEHRRPVAAVLVVEPVEDGGQQP